MRREGINVDPNVAIAISASLLALALLVALVTVVVLGSWLWMEARRSPEAEVPFDGYPEVPEAIPSVPPRWSPPPTSVPRQSVDPSASAPTAPHVPVGFFDDDSAATHLEDLSRSDVYGERHLLQYWMEEPVGEEATEIFAAHAGDFADFGIDDNDEPTGRFN